MSDFRCIAVTAALGERWRRTGVDDNANPLRRVVGAGSPCRHCLRDASPGDEMLLGSYNLPRPRGIYWTPSPIFVHAGPCAPFTAINEVAPIVRGRLVSVRAYDQDDQCIYDLGHAGDGREVDAPLLHALADPRTAFVNLHTAKPGCMLCRVERI